MKRAILLCLIILFSCNKKIKNNEKTSYYRIFTVDYINNENDSYVKGLIINDYQGKISDSINTKRIKYLRLSNSNIIGDRNTTFDSVSHLSIHDSKLYDTIFNLKNFPQLKYLSLRDNVTEFIIEDSIPIRNLLLGIYSEYAKNTNVDATKLYALDSIMVECEKCIIKLPKRELKRMVISTNEIDTFYNNPPSIFSDDKTQEQRK